MTAEAIALTVVLLTVGCVAGPYLTTETTEHCYSCEVQRQEIYGLSQDICRLTSDNKRLQASLAHQVRQKKRGAVCVRATTEQDTRSGTGTGRVYYYGKIRD